MQIMGGAALSNPVVRAACMHSNSAIWARAMLISFLGFRLNSLVANANAIPCLAAYQVSIESLNVALAGLLVNIWPGCRPK